MIYYIEIYPVTEVVYIYTDISWYKNDMKLDVIFLKNITIDGEIKRILLKEFNKLL